MVMDTFLGNAPENPEFHDLMRMDKGVTNTASALDGKVHCKDMRSFDAVGSHLDN